MFAGKGRAVDVVGLVAVLLSIPLVSATELAAAEETSKPARVEEARREAARLKEKAAVLEGLIGKAQEKGIDVSAQEISLTVAKLFVEFIPRDALVTADDLPADGGRWFVSIWSILGREETLKRIEQLTSSQVQATDGVLDRAIEEVRFDNSQFDYHILPLYRKARERGMFVAAFNGNYTAPAWLAEIAPDIVLGWGKGWFRDYMDIDHPLLEKYERSYLGNNASQLKQVPNSLCYSLMGEGMCCPRYRGKHTEARYANWLKERHGTIENLNEAWGTTYRDVDKTWGIYKDFLAAADRESLKTKGGHYDWHAFNQYRLTALNQWQIDAIKAADPNARTTAWPAAGGLVSAPLGAFDSLLGRNREDIIHQGCITGWDGAMIAREAGPTTRRLPESHWAKYNMGWRDELIYYDFAKSIAPDQPIVDLEMHSVTSVYHLTPLGISPDYMRTSLWLQHLHGMGAHLIWWWGREADGSPRWGEFLGGLLTQPQLLDSWGRTMLELRRLAEYIVLFPQLERKVRILYSESSSIQDVNVHPPELARVYEALYFLDYPVGFITERMIQEGKLKDCSLRRPTLA